MGFFKLLRIRNITGKLIILMLLVILVVFTALGVFVYVNVSSMIENEAIKSETQLMKTVSTSIEDNLYQCIETVTQLPYDSTVNRVINSHGGGIDTDTERSLEEVFSRNVEFNNNISSVIICSGKFSLTYPRGNIGVTRSMLEDILKRRNSPNILKIRKDNELVSKIRVGGSLDGKRVEEEHLVVIRPQDGGFIAVILKNDLLKGLEKYNSFYLSRDETCIELDIQQNSKGVYVPGTEDTGISLKKVLGLKDREDDSWNRIDGFEGYVYKKDFYSINASFLCTLPMKNTRQDLTPIAVFIIVTFLLGTVAFLAISLLVLYGLNRPLKELKSFVDTVNVNDRKTRTFQNRRRGRIRRVTGRIRLKDKLYLVLVCCTVIPVIIVVMFVYYRSSAIMSDRINLNTMQSIEIASSRIGGVIDGYKRMTRNIMRNGEVRKLLAKGAQQAVGNNLSFEIMREQMSNYKFVNVVLLDNNKNIVYSLIPEQMSKGVSGLLDMYGPDNSNGKPVWTDITYDRSWDYVYSILWEIGGDNAGMEHGKKIGYVITTFTFLDVEKVFKSTLDRSYGEFYIVDGKNRFVYNSEKSRINTTTGIELKGAAGSNGTYYLRDNKRNNIYVSPVSGIDWRVVGRIPRSEMQSAVRLFQLTSLYILLLCILGMLLAARVTANHFVNRITRLEAVMGSVEAGDLGSRYRDKTGDEIEALGNSFNNMLSRIQQLVRELAAAAVKEKELESQKNLAELKALHAQINPHFLYNTLESINSLALVKGMDEISSMAVALGNMFRFSIKSGDEFVTFREEVSHAVNYLKIQKIRYSDLFSYKVDIDPLIYDCCCVKLILQPIVENAIYHGVESRGENGIILIKGDIQENRVRITVEDNGAGMEKGKNNDINEKLDGAVVDSSDGIGLANVNRRIKLYYGNEFGVRVFSTSGKGTRVEIWLPYIRKE